MCADFWSMPADAQQSISIAFGDESIRISAPTPCYVMAATVLPEGADFSELAKIKPRGSAKLHWREPWEDILKSVTVLETKI